MGFVRDLDYIIQGPRVIVGDMRATAVLSMDEVYRYVLRREWNGTLPQFLFVMLNPSTADAFVTDNTVNSCKRITLANGFGGFSIINLHAYRTKSPSIMRRQAAAGVDIIGPQNAWWQETMLMGHRGSNRIVCAWGANVEHDDEVVVEFMALMERVKLCYPMCLGTTNGGQPRHPLFLRADTALQPFQLEEAL